MTYDATDADDDGVVEADTDNEKTTTDQIGDDIWFVQALGGDEAALLDAISQAGQRDRIFIGNTEDDTNQIVVTSTITGGQEHLIGNYRSYLYLDSGVDSVLLDAYGSGVQYRGVMFNGNKANQTAANPVVQWNGVDEHIKGCWIWKSKGRGAWKRRGYGTKVEHSFFENCDDWAFYAEHDGTGNGIGGIHFDHCKFNGSNGGLFVSSFNARVTNCQIRNDAGATNPLVHSKGEATTLRGNEMNGKVLIEGGETEIVGGNAAGEIEMGAASTGSRIVGVHSDGSGARGVLLNTNGYTIANNVIANAAGEGVHLNGVSDSTIVGNVIRGSGDWGFRAFSGNNIVVVGNVIKDCSTNQADMVRLNSSTGLTFSHNIINASSALGSAKDGIYIDSLTDSRIENNILYGPQLASGIDDQGGHTNLVIKNNTGFQTANDGTATFSGDGATTTFTVNHGMDVTPDRVVFSPDSAAASGDAYVSAKTSTSFDVTFGTAPASGTDNVVLSWYAFDDQVF